MNNLALSVPFGHLDADKIIGKEGRGSIYQGSLPPPGRLCRSKGFHVLVLCAEELQPPAELYDDLRVIHSPIDDAVLKKDEWKRSWESAVEVAKRVKTGEKVLVTCAAGFNRSGLVTAISLWMLTGAPGDVIVRHVRSRRRGALRNASFVRAIEQLKRRQ